MGHNYGYIGVLLVTVSRSAVIGPITASAIASLPAMDIL
jgi:hypothetical protein